jgi:hypothetical protein
MMGIWVRGGEPPDEIKVTFVVNARKDPELAAWLWALPYRGTSASVRDILSAAARRLGLPAATTVRSDAQGSKNPEGASPTGKDPTLPQSATSAPSSKMNDTQGVTDAVGNEGMTDAVVKLMREMDDEF